MPANKNALIRYKTIDNCLRNRYRRWTLDDLVEACSDALYDMEETDTEDGLSMISWKHAAMLSTTWRESPKEYAPELFRWTYRL